jgi:hypothetical protein
MSKTVSTEGRETSENGELDLTSLPLASIIAMAIAEPHVANARPAIGARAGSA